MSKSVVFEALAQYDAAVEELRTYRIEDDYLVFMVGTTYLKVRVNYRIYPMGLSRDAMKELIGFRLKK